LLALISLTSSPALADEEIASPAELAKLASTHQRLQAEFERQMHARHESSLGHMLERDLASRTTRLLNQRIQRQKIAAASRHQAAPPAAMQGLPSPEFEISNELTSNTTCTMVENTLECVLRAVDRR